MVYFFIKFIMCTMIGGYIHLLFAKLIMCPMTGGYILLLLPKMIHLVDTPLFIMSTYVPRWFHLVDTLYLLCFILLMLFACYVICFVECYVIWLFCKYIQCTHLTYWFGQIQMKIHLRISEKMASASQLDHNPASSLQSGVQPRTGVTLVYSLSLSSVKSQRLYDNVVYNHVIKSHVNPY